MTVLKMVGLALALQLVTVPAMAQATSDKSENAHHYQGGPKTVVPHSMKHPKSTKGVACPSRKSYPHIAMVQSGKNWCGDYRSQHWWSPLSRWAPESIPPHGRQALLTASTLDTALEGDDFYLNLRGG
jgi:hypothetical protein